MLTFKRLKIQNFCQHKKLEIEFSAGVVGIIGRNGAGKSNLIKALFRALTGKALNPGKKEEDVTWGAEGGALELDFVINGKEATLIRDLATERCSLVVGEEKVRKSKDIERKLYPFLGVSPRVLADIVFVMQGKIEGILFQEPAERVKAFQHLFGTQNAERIRDLLNDELTNLNVESREEQIRQFRKKLEIEVLPPLAEAEKVIQDWNRFQLSDDDRHEIERLLDLQRRAYFSSERIKEIQPAYERADEDVIEAEENIRVWTTKVAEAQKVLQDLAPAREAAQTVLAAAAQAGEIKARRTRLGNDEAACLLTLEQDKPHCPIESDALDKSKSQLTRAEGEYEQYRKLVAAGKGTLGVTNHCPTCGQELSEEHIVEAKLKYDRMTQPLLNLRAAVAESDTLMLKYLHECSTQAANKRNAQTQLERIRLELASLPTVEELDPASVKEAGETVESIRKLEDQAREVESKLRVAQDTLKALRSLRQERLLELEALKSDISKDPGAEAVVGAKDSLNNDSKARQEVARASGARDSLLKQKTSFENQIAIWEAEEVKLAKLRQWREHLENVRRLLHRDALPGEVARSYLGVLNERLAYYLELFGSPFAAKIDSDGTVTCQFSDKPSVPSERLSGGQKVVLGVAFRFAIYDLFVADLGVMILDEPTVYLDKNNVSAVAELLNHLKGYSRAAGIQLIVVTHEQQLADSFDQVISLGS